MAFVEGNVTNINAYRLSLQEAEDELVQAKAKRDNAKALLKDKEAELKATEEPAEPKAKPANRRGNGSGPFRVQNNSTGKTGANF